MKVADIPSKVFGDGSFLARTFERIRKTLWYLKDYAFILRLRLLRKFQAPRRDPNLIVSLTSFPARIDYAWFAIESILLQDLLPARVALVLAEEEFPRRELPNSIRRLTDFGLEIIWTPDNIGSYKKLIPVRRRYPNAKIITFDDDIMYEPSRVRELIEASKKKPGVIIGHRGWELKRIGQHLYPYIEWLPASKDTPMESCFLTGGAGALYPPNTLPLDILFDTESALKYCPSADDVWFWAIARNSGVPNFCIGNHRLRSVKSLKKSPALHRKNWSANGNDEQINSVINYFDLRL